ncbi:MAG TPA: nucleotidyl transferase AbiEii/AbiGii toxin family protein [Bacilli bacterium]|nr:nucleotidyl transferase AbiEii/AbiGii toxin family protein [Bacilli bacterium]
MTIITQMLKKYNLKTIEETKNALKEVFQEVILAGLSKTDFFSHAAFYGGTALRIFYGLERFSEDLDFSLRTSDSSFALEKYLKPVEDALKSLGLNFAVTTKENTVHSTIDSVFIKGNTKQIFIAVFKDSEDYKKIIHNEKMVIKLEVDIDPPPYANTELKYRLLPYPYQVRVYDMESLFAGKVHALIARKWDNRVKGRDLYDYIYYLSLNTKVNLKHLEARLKQTKSISENEVLTRELLIEILNKRFADIDYQAAKKDVIPFLKDQSVLELWSPSFFKDITINIITN